MNWYIHILMEIKLYTYKREAKKISVYFVRSRVRIREYAKKKLYVCCTAKGREDDRARVTGDYYLVLTQPSIRFSFSIHGVQRDDADHKLLSSAMAISSTLQQQQQKDLM